MQHQPLIGRRIAITRPAQQAGPLLAQLRALGAEPLACPTIAIAAPDDFAPLDAAIGRLASYDWLIVTSANGVHALLGRMAALGIEAAALGRLTIGAIGPATAAALAEYGLRAAFMPSEYVAEAIVAEIGALAGQRILLPRADIARAVLAEGLRAGGAQVDVLAAYRTLPGPGIATLAELLPAGRLDAIAFTSASTVRFLLAGLRDQRAHAALAATRIVCIGPITAAAARAAGLPVAAVAAEYTAAGLVNALLGLLAE